MTKALTRQTISGSQIANAVILARRNCGRVPTGNGESVELESLLLVSQYGAVSDLDLKDLFQLTLRPYGMVPPWERLEPGSVIYYVVKLPHGISPRPLGSTPIGVDYLVKSKKYLDLASAKEAFKSA